MALRRAFSVISITLICFLFSGAVDSLGQTDSSSATASVPNDSYRSWKDVTGKHVMRAKFLGVVDRQKVALETEAGKQISIELSQLSNVDIYEAVKADLMKKLVSGEVSLDGSTRAVRAPRSAIEIAREELQPRLRRATIPTALTSVQESKPQKPLLGERFKTRVAEMTEAVENDEADTVFKTLLTPEDYQRFRQADYYSASVRKFDKAKRKRLLQSLKSIKMESAYMRGDGKLTLQTGADPMSFEYSKGVWYLKN